MARRIPSNNCDKLKAAGLDSSRQLQLDRRSFSTGTLVAGTSALVGAGADTTAQEEPEVIVVDDFKRNDTFYHGDMWESLNPGYWKVQDNSLRRRVRTRGDRARATGFPYHYRTHNRNNGVMDAEYITLPPYGMIWRRDWQLTGAYSIIARFEVLALPTETPGFDTSPGQAVMGICFGANTTMESWTGGAKRGDACWFAAVRDNQTFGVYDHAKDTPTTATANSESKCPQLKAGDQVVIQLTVRPEDAVSASVTAELRIGDEAVTVTCDDVQQDLFTHGYFGLVSRGLLDFKVTQLDLIPFDNTPLNVELNPLRLAIPLGHTLHQDDDGNWACRFVTVMRDNGDETEIRISTEEKPADGWEAVPAAGSAPIITNDFRRATSIVDVTLPANPGETDLYYTIWKDGENVTHDPRSGYLGQKDYVGKLPQLSAPYRLCGLSCHAIHGQFDGGNAGKFQENWVHDQPALSAYEHLDDYNFQIMVWEDDIWYLELLLYTTSVDDAYLQIMTAIAGPTSRWQVMRHWNVLNPGDHDYGMDDVKGPEQIAIRNRDDLGQDPAYMGRNFQIVQHLVRGEENPSATENPKRWAAWKMPNQDFTLMMIDARLWRSSQDTHIWATEGWGGDRDIYDRTDPTRSLLGEAQFAWLQQVITTDTSPMILLTGLNGMHTVWEPSPKLQRNRVVADYAGWVKAGCDRVIELLATRDGVVSVYGDVHNGCIMTNTDHNLIECSFGPIGRTGGRQVKPGFGRTMVDHDERPLTVHSLYHREFQSPDLEKRTGPQYWNFLEMHLDPTGDGAIQFRVRNLIDAPTNAPRGGGSLNTTREKTGRPITCLLPKIKVIPLADVRFQLLDGQPLRGIRSNSDGTLPIKGLVDVAAGESIVMTTVKGDQAFAQVIKTLPLDG